MVCSQCKKKFTKTHYNQKYCSKECAKIKNIEWKIKYFTPEKRKENRLKYKSNPQNKKTHDDYNKKYLINNPDYYKEYNKKMSVEDKAKRKKYFQVYLKTHSIKPSVLNRRNEWFRNQRRENPLFKLSSQLRSRTYIMLKRKTLVKKSKLLEILGCTLPELKNHLEKQFTSGMNWDNNTLHGWHVDHIIPLASAKTVEEVERLCHYTNLQPLWAIDNILKSDKLI